MARPREFSNETIFYAVYLALCQKGISKLTINDISNEANISPAGLLKRFGSKKGILLAYSDFVVQLTKKSFDEALKKEESSINALKKIYKNAMKLADDPVSLANHASFYLESTSDPDLLQISKKRLDILDKGTQTLLKQAIAQGEIKKCDVNVISTVLQSSVGGAMLLWIRNPERTIEALIDDCFSVILRPYH
ncbi:TetR/AcrR family transcriptional regulator [Alkalihalobacillus hemicellulosilyticus]|uniref:Transcriptional regulator n=1 Tax=Halalkalibacter hemicellulosilyticusJCM 9152 TaxID=1236971 RepID=W4QCC3_9BACI|nr:helix-turn-helix domain-containing protein [Halalkalibacter hemicellulosilyticus]GAE29328.1 transcriptional regulator [Halalkalibacter hemicellulosilyticusJCM 9152]